jgi:hypothetical protein
MNAAALGSKKWINLLLPANFYIDKRYHPCILSSCALYLFEHYRAKNAEKR